MEQDNRPVKVDFPSKMRVTSPEIDSINKTSSRISNWLHNDFKNIIEPLTVVKFIPDLIKDLSKTIVTQFTNLLLGQVESDVINRQANIKVLKSKIETTQSHILQKEQNLNKTVELINNRYASLSDQLNQEHETFLRNLDSHAYEIIEKNYPEDIQKRFSYESLPNIDFLSEHAEVSVSDRNTCLENGYHDSSKEVLNFIENRQLFYSELNEYHCQELTEGSYELPWCFIEFENRKTGETKLECWFECELNEGEMNPELDELRAEIEKQANKSFLLSEIIYELFDDFMNSSLPETEKQRFKTDLQS